MCLTASIDCTDLHISKPVPVSNSARQAIPYLNRIYIVSCWPAGPGSFLDSPSLGGRPHVLISCRIRAMRPARASHLNYVLETVGSDLGHLCPARRCRKSHSQPYLPCLSRPSAKIRNNAVSAHRERHTSVSQTRRTSGWSEIMGGRKRSHNERTTGEKRHLLTNGICGEARSEGGSLHHNDKIQDYRITVLQFSSMYILHYARTNPP